jgi:hypothetical protein
MSSPRSRELFRSITVSFLERREADSFKLKNCPAYIRGWILREQHTPNE